ncbi:MAG: D-glycerate dehydrogenase [Planctomycetota bacterium]
MPFNVYVTRRIPEAGLDVLRAGVGRMDVNPDDRVLGREALLRAVKGRDGVLCLLTDRIDAGVFEAAKGAKIFSNYAVGFDNVDLAAASKRGILVTNTPGILTETTADMAWALIFATARRIAEGDRFVRAGKFSGWGPMMLLGGDVHGKTLGIVGFGRIGAAVARRAAGFGMRVLYAEAGDGRAEGDSAAGAKRADLDALLRESDFVSLHVPLIPGPPPKGTRHLISARSLALMKPTACLVNTSRGPVVDEAALADALKAGRIFAAGLDVYEQEPEVHPALLACENAVLLPHLGSATVETRARMAVVAAENLLAGLQGKRPPNLLNPEAWIRQSKVLSPKS